MKYTLHITKHLRIISTAQLNVSPRVHLQPINLVVYQGPQTNRNLEDGFALRCFQRLSKLNVATQQCPWQDNW